MPKIISIIGAGPIGGYLAYLLSSQGNEVHVYEEHSEIGLPVHCTGIVTSKFSSIIKPDKEFVVNTINKARIYSPGDECLELGLGKNYVLDRAKLDQKLAEGAEKADARFHLSHKFVDFREGKLLLKHNEKAIKQKTDILIGADGPNSPVARSAGLFGERRFFKGMQARVQLKNDNAVEFYLFKGGFSWVVPESRTLARIGSASIDNPNNPFRELMSKKLGADFEKTVLEYQGGIIPIHNPKINAQAGNIFLVGDAATMVKASTGGGIVPGLLGAEALADSLSDNSGYGSLWRERIGRELKLSLQVRILLDSFSSRDLDLMIRLMNKKGIKERLASYDRDSLGSLLPGMLLEALKEPRFLHFARYLLNRNLYI